jgi:hypothetical protein
MLRKHSYLKSTLAVNTIKTESRLVEEWDDEPEEGRSKEDWPYPNHYQKTKIEGPLANAIRKKAEMMWSDEVFITEVIVSGGWSDYTQEETMYLKIQVGNRSFQLGDEDTDTNLGALLEWLDK